MQPMQNRLYVQLIALGTCSAPAPVKYGCIDLASARLGECRDKSATQPVFLHPFISKVYHSLIGDSVKKKTRISR